MTPQQRAKMRSRILDAARDRFLEKGLDGLSMRGIASKVGVSSMTLYLYYDGRQDIVRHIVAEGFEQLRKKLVGAIDAAPEGAELQGFSQAYIDFAMESPDYYTAMYRYLGDTSQEEPDDLLDEVRYAPLRILKEALGDAARATALWSGLHGLAMLAISGQVPGEHRPPEVGKLLASALA